MHKRSSKDINETAYAVVSQIIGKPKIVSVAIEPAKPDTTPIKVVVEKKNPAAVALGRLGGLKGGKARAASLSAEKRKQIAQKAAKARWK